MTEHPSVDFSPEEVINLFSSSPMKEVKAEKTGFPYRDGHVAIETTVYISIKDQWYRVCRTDLWDDVRTTCPLEDSIENYKYKASRNSLGARLGKDFIAIIDSVTDG